MGLTTGREGGYDSVLGQQLLEHIKRPLAWSGCEVESGDPALNRYVEAAIHSLSLGLDLSR